MALSTKEPDRNAERHRLISERFREALADSGLSQQELSDLSGVSKSSISQYCHGTASPLSDRTKKLADVLHVSPGWLMGFPLPKHGFKRDAENQTMALRFPPSSPSLHPEISVIAEGSAYGTDSDVYVPYDEVVTAPDDAMSGARICAGDTVYLSTEILPGDGDIVAVQLDGQLLLRRYQVRKADSAVLLSPENDRHALITVALEDVAARLQICGVAVGFLSRL